MEQTWRTSPFARIGGTAAAVGIGALGVVVAVQTVLDFTGAGLLLAVLCFAMAASLVFIPFNAFIRADDAGVCYRNLFTTTTIPWADLRACRAGYNGISLLRADGSVRIGLAVQKSNMAKWRHWRTRADDVCDVIERRRRERGA